MREQWTHRHTIPHCNRTQHRAAEMSEELECEDIQSSWLLLEGLKVKQSSLNDELINKSFVFLKIH